eukprot:360927-Chlamydomonas_euryale.AAC.2
MGAQRPQGRRKRETRDERACVEEGRAEHACEGWRACAHCGATRAGMMHGQTHMAIAARLPKPKPRRFGYKADGRGEGKGRVRTSSGEGARTTQGHVRDATKATQGQFGSRLAFDDNV